MFRYLHQSTTFRFLTLFTLFLSLPRSSVPQIFCKESEFRTLIVFCCLQMNQNVNLQMAKVPYLSDFTERSSYIKVSIVTHIFRV